MLSSVDDMLSLTADQFDASNLSPQQKSSHSGKGRSSSSNWSLEKIYSKLNFQADLKEQLESNAMLYILGAQRFFAWDNHTLEQIPRGTN